MLPLRPIQAATPFIKDLCVFHWWQIYVFERSFGMKEELIDDRSVAVEHKGTPVVLVLVGQPTQMRLDLVPFSIR
jgi:hypothetical protein